MAAISKVKLTKDQEEHANHLHGESIVIDALQGVLAADPDRYHPEFMEGGLTACFQDIGGGTDHSPYPEVTPGDFKSNVKGLDSLRDTVDAHPDKFLFAEYAEDIKRAKKEEKIALVPHMQACSSAIEDDLAYLRALHRLGLKVIMLTYNSRTPVGTGCCEEEDTGLTEFGLEVVAEMNRVGVVVDASHASDTTTPLTWWASTTWVSAPTPTGRASTRAGAARP